MIICYIYHGRIGSNTNHIFMRCQMMANNPLYRSPSIFCPTIYGYQIEFTIFFGGRWVRIFFPTVQSIYFCNFFYCINHNKCSYTNRNGSIIGYRITIHILCTTFYSSLGFSGEFQISIYLFNDTFGINNHLPTGCGSGCCYIFFIKGGCFRTTLTIQ